jgi:hypothetical protein
LKARVDRTEELIAAAMTSMAEASLQECLDEANSFKYGSSDTIAGFDNIVSASALLDRVREAEKKFTSAIAFMGSAELEEAIAFAMAFGYGDASKPLVAGQVIKAKAEELKARVDTCTASLQQAMASLNEETLKKALAEAHSFGWGASDQVAGFSLVQEATILHGLIKRENELVVELTAAELVGQASGVAGDLVSPDPAPLKTVVDAAVAHKFHTKVGLHRRAQGQWLLGFRVILSDALKSGLPSTDPVWQSVDAALDEGFNDPISVGETAEFTLIREDLILRGGIEATLKKIEAATVVLDEAALASALAAADHWKMDEHPQESIRTARADALALHARVVACIAGLTQALATMGEVELEAAAAEARSFGFGKDGASPPISGVAMVAEAEALKLKVVSCTNQLNASLESMDELELEESLAAASLFGWGATPLIAGHALVNQASELKVKVHDTEAALANALRKMDSALLQEALATAAAFGYGSNDEEKKVAGKEVVAAASALKVRVDECCAALNTAVVSLMLGDLNTSLQEAHSFGWGASAAVAGFEEVKVAKETKEKVEGVEAALGSAQANMNEQELSSALQAAHALGYGNAPITTATTSPGAAEVVVVVAGVELVASAVALKQRVQLCDQALCAAVACMEQKQLEKALAEADDFFWGDAGLNPNVAGVDLVATARSLNSRVTKCELLLSKALKTMGEGDLRDALDDAASFGFGNPDTTPPVAGVASVKEARALLEKVVKCEALLAKALQSKNEADVDAALAFASEVGYGKQAGDGSSGGVGDDSGAAQWSESGNPMNKTSRNAMARRLSSVADPAVAGLLEVVVAGVEVVKAAQQLKADMGACVDQLSKAVKALELSQLEAALVVAKPFSLLPVGAELVEEAVVLKDRVASLEVLLSKALASFQLSELEQAIDDAEALGYGECVR